MLTGVTEPGSAPKADCLLGSACLLALLSQDHTPLLPRPATGAGVSRLPSSTLPLIEP